MTDHNEVKIGAFPDTLWRKAKYYPGTKEYWYEPVWVLKVTAHRVIVQDIDNVCYTLDRDRLERRGQSYHSAGYLFCLKKGADAAESVRELYDRKTSTEAAEILGLVEPYTTETVKTAYRKMAASHHPDVGGEHDKFIVIHSAYQSLLERVA